MIQTKKKMEKIKFNLDCDDNQNVCISFDYNWVLTKVHFVFDKISYRYNIDEYV